MAAAAAVSTADIEARLDRLITEAEGSSQPTPLTRNRVVPGVDPDSEEPFSRQELEIVFRKLLLKLGVSKERVLACIAAHSRNDVLSGHHEVVAYGNRLSVFVHGFDDRSGFALYLAPAGYRQT